MSWQRVRLGAVCTKITDGTHKTPKYVENGVCFLSAKNINNGYLNVTNCKFITTEEHEDLKKRCFPEAGDVMLSKSGSLGEAVMVPDLDFEFSVFESLALLKVDRSKIVPEFLQQLLSSPQSKKYFHSITTGLAVKHLHLVDLRKMRLILPPIPEQTAIADLLSTWDAAIEKTEKLVAVKEKQFSWLRIQLLNPGTHWCHVKLHAICSIKKGEQLSKVDMIEDGEYYVLNGGITPSGYINKWNTPENTITISEGGNSCGFVSFNRDPFWTGGHCYSLRELNPDIDTNFLYHSLKCHEKRIMRLRVGSGLPNIQRKDVENIHVSFPSIPEQQQIAETLNTASHEIDLLNNLTDVYHSQKRGLMQKLLTGSWRVDSEIVNQVSEAGG